ncbi:hypothetical protein ACA910_012592 [Epithemia clementina (nom. ined.)]
MASEGSSDKPTLRQSYHFMVVVLGDLGRSPRMQYHVLSLLQAGHFVTFVGYTGEQLVPPLLKYAPKASGGVVTRDSNQPPTLRVVRFPAPKVDILRSHSLLLPLYFAWRCLSLFVLLVTALTLVKAAPLPSTGEKVKPQAILMQNPPAIPILSVMVAYKYWTGAKLIIDWHNLGYSMIEKENILLRFLGRQYEEALAPFADGHLTVTRALQTFLKNEMKIDNDNCSVLHDCPPSIFRLRTLVEQHKILEKNHEKLMKALADNNVDWPELTQKPSLEDAKSTLLTEPVPKRPGKFQPRSQRPALLVSSTSWTADEDMDILIDALQMVDKRIQETKSSLRIICAITGKGPLKEHYEEIVAKKTWKSVFVTTLWMEPADYPTFLATADVGISLHTSTSGMDLPIKILDYFGCEVPVCAYQFPCLNELVQDDVNGRTFEKADELSEILVQLLEPLASAKPDERFGNHDFGDLKRYSLQVQGQLLWSENWPKNAWPVIERSLRKAPSPATAETAEKSKDD